MAGRFRVFCLLVLWGAAGSAEAQRLIFTTRTGLNDPVQILAHSSSKQSGFDFATVYNEAKKAVETVRLEVKSTSPNGEEVTLEGADFLVRLNPGERKRLSVGMGRISELTAKAKAQKQRVARATLEVAAVGYADGSEWRSGEPVIFDPLVR